MTAPLGLEECLIDVDGGSVQVFVGGSGAIVTCQASPTGTPLPHPLTEFARSAGRIVAINPRGAGGSSPLDKSTGPIRQLVTDAEVVRRRLGIERWVLMGQSRGGWFALEYALRYPQTVAGLILTDTSSSWRFYQDMDSIYNNQRADFQQIQEIRSRAMVADATVDDLKRWMGLTYHQSGAIERLAPQRIAARHNPASIGVEVPELLIAMRDEVLGRPPHHEPWDVTDRLHEIVAPALIVHGRFDNIIPPRWCELLHERIANSELVLCDSGHFAFDEEPDNVRTSIQSFIAERIAARN